MLPSNSPETPNAANNALTTMCQDNVHVLALALPKTIDQSGWQTIHCFGRLLWCIVQKVVNDRLLFCVLDVTNSA